MVRYLNFSLKIDSVRDNSFQSGSSFRIKSSPAIQDTWGINKSGRWPSMLEYLLPIERLHIRRTQEGTGPFVAAAPSIIFSIILCALLKKSVGIGKFESKPALVMDKRLNR